MHNNCGMSSGSLSISSSVVEHSAQGESMIDNDYDY